MARELNFPAFDTGNHMYETEAAFTRYLPRTPAPGCVRSSRTCRRSTTATPRSSTLEQDQAKIMGGNLAKLMKVA